MEISFTLEEILGLEQYIRELAYAQKIPLFIKKKKKHPILACHVFSSCCLK